MTLARLARASAIAIALVAMVDPLITARRAVRPDVAVLPAAAGVNQTSVARDDGEAERLADRVAAHLARDFTVTRAPYAGAAALVSIGDVPPDVQMTAGQRAFAVRANARGPALRLRVLAAPRVASLDARVPVALHVQAAGASGRLVTVTLEQDQVPMDAATWTPASHDDETRVTLHAVPARAGALVVRARARVGADGASERAGDSTTAWADAVVDITTTRRRVLFYDRRPSWTSTFVRRALERDARVEVDARIAASRGVTQATAGAPAALTTGALTGIEVVVAGAPALLTAQDAGALDAFARRGGAVVLLFDDTPSGPAAALAPAARWQAATDAKELDLAAAAVPAAALRGRSMAWPDALPPLAEPLATREPDGGAVIWRHPVGAGHIVVSTAFDAWRFRARSRAFDEFWAFAIADAASRVPPPLEVLVDRGGVHRPGAAIGITVFARDLAAAFDDEGAASGTIAASIVAADGSRTTLRLWPDDVGIFRGTARAPMEPGVYRVAASLGGQTSSASPWTSAEAPLVVDPGAASPDFDADLVAAWASAHGGEVVREDELDALTRLLRAGAPDSLESIPVRPMRSPWWIVPFATLLGCEWWLRRRRGFA